MWVTITAKNTKKHFFLKSSRWRHFSRQACLCTSGVSIVPDKVFLTFWHMQTQCHLASRCLLLLYTIFCCQQPWICVCLNFCVFVYRRRGDHSTVHTVFPRKPLRLDYPTWEDRNSKGDLLPTGLQGGPGHQLAWKSGQRHKGTCTHIQYIRIQICKALDGKIIGIPFFVHLYNIIWIYLRILWHQSFPALIYSSICKCVDLFSRSFALSFFFSLSWLWKFSHSLDPSQFHFNPAQSVLVMEADDLESINTAMTKVSYINSRQFPTPGLRKLHITTTVQWVPL